MIFLYSKLDIQNKGEGLGNLQDFVEEPIVTWNASGYLEVEFKYFLHGDLAEHMIPDAKLKTRIHSNDEVYHLFTIYEVEPDYIENTIQVRAEMTLLHELKDRVVPAGAMSGTANDLIMFVKNKMDRDYPFVITGSTDGTVFIEHDNISAYELIFGEDGILKRTGAEIGFTDRGIRLSNRIGTIHRDELRESDFVSNLTVNESQGEDFVTRIIPFTTAMFDRPLRDGDRYTRETVETPTYGTPVVSPNIANKLYKVRTKFVEYRNEPTEVTKYYNYRTERGTETLEMNEYVYEDVTALNQDASTFFEDNIGIDEPTTTISIETLGLAKGYYTYLRYLNRYDIVTIYVEPKPYLTNTSETYVVQVNETVYEPLSDNLVSIGFTNDSMSLRDAYRNVNEGRISDQQLQAELQKERLRDLQDRLINYVYNHDGFRLEFGNVLPPPDEYREGDMYYLETGEGIDLYKLVNGAWEFVVGQSTREIIEGKFEEMEILLDGLSTEISDNEAIASDAVAKAEESLEKIGTIDTKISDLRTDLNTVGDKAESSLEIIGIDGGVMYSKNRRLGSKSQPIQPDDRGLIQHNGEGFELGETYTVSMKVSCIYDDIITWEDRSRTESVPFVRETQYRTDLYPDESFVQRNGINGTTTYAWQIELVNGEPTGNKTEEVVSNHQAPVNEIFIQGTREEITWEERSRTESIPFVREIQYRTDLSPEESYIERDGINGTATYIWEVELLKGELTGNKTEEVRTNYQAPVNEIFIQGTHEELFSDVTFNFDVVPFVPPVNPTSDVTFNFTEEGTQTGEWYATPSVNVSNINQAPSSWRTMSLVNDFGAVGDGVTDDSQALKNALQHSNTEPIRLDVGGSEYEYYIPSNGNTRIENYPGVSKGIVIFGNGAVFAPKNERTIDKHEFYLMQIRAEKNAFVETYGFTLDGKHNPQDMFWWISQGMATRAADLPLQKGISYEGSDNIYIHDMTYRNMYGGYVIKLKNYTNVDIQHIRGYSVGGNDNPDSFGTIVHIDGQPDDSYINIDDMIIHGKKSPLNPAWVSWIGIVIENGTTQSDDASVRLADRNTNIHVTNSEFYDFESLYHIETQAGNIYWNTDNVKARVMNYTIGAGVRGEIKDRSNHMQLDILPFMRKGLSSGLYHTYRERPSNNLTDEHGAYNHFHMYNSIINYLPKEDYVGGVDVHAISHADSVVGNLHNVTLNNVPRWLVANASANLYDTQVNLKQGYNSSYSIFSNPEQYLSIHGTSSYNQAGSWKDATKGSYPPLAVNTGFVAPPLTGKIGDILPPA